MSLNQEVLAGYSVKGFDKSFVLSTGATTILRLPFEVGTIDDITLTPITFEVRPTEAPIDTFVSVVFDALDGARVITEAQSSTWGARSEVYCVCSIEIGGANYALAQGPVKVLPNTTGVPVVATVVLYNDVVVLLDEIQAIYAAVQVINTEAQATSLESQATIAAAQAANADSLAINAAAQVINDDSQAINTATQVINADSQAINTATQAINADSLAINAAAQVINDNSQAIKAAIDVLYGNYPGVAACGSGMVGFAGVNWRDFSANGRATWTSGDHFGSEPDITTSTPVSIVTSVKRIRLAFTVSSPVLNTKIAVSFKDRATNAITHIISDIDLSVANTESNLEVDLTAYSGVSAANVYLSFVATVAPSATTNVPFTWAIT